MAGEIAELAVAISLFQEARNLLETRGGSIALVSSGMHLKGFGARDLFGDERQCVRLRRLGP